MLIRTLLFLLLCLPVKLFAQSWQSLHSLLPKGTQLSYLAYDTKTGKLISAHQSETLRTPASMQKLLTATAAKLYLGENFRYQSRIEGEKKLLKNGVYQGDIRFRFVGDPTLKRADIAKMFAQLRKMGIKQIRGDFLLNGNHYNGYQWSNGQAWNDLGVCYTAPSHAIIINKNCVLGNLSLASKDAKKATLFIPAYEPVEITSDVNVVSKGQKAQQFCDLEVTRNSQNRYHLWGCMVPRKRAFGLAFAVNDPFEYARKIIAVELEKAAIKLSGKVVVDDVKAEQRKQQVFVEHSSQPLDPLLQEMMKESDNLIADSLFKTLGGAFFMRPGNFRNGAAAVKQILKEHGIDLENAYLADGSGLSRHNLMSAELFMNVLSYVYKHDAELNLLSSFSVAGIDGTLKYHRGVRGAQFKGKVIAKTGSMKGVTNLLGVVKNNKGDRLFVLILNGYNLPKEPVESKLKRDEKASNYLFQQHFFQRLVE